MFYWLPGIKGLRQNRHCSHLSRVFSCLHIVIYWCNFNK